jgi:enoyl-[acyl-carrier protein] reductase I
MASQPSKGRTRTVSGITDFDELIAKAEAKAPARSLVSIDDDDVGVAVAFLCMNGAKLIAGETLYIDCGYHIID